VKAELFEIGEAPVDGPLCGVIVLDDDDVEGVRVAAFGGARGDDGHLVRWPGFGWVGRVLGG